MCVIMVKNKGISFPEETILRNCWEHNPDMGGFMYTYKGNVHIEKGFLTFADFMEALNKARKKTGDNVPYVLHFRISTQGYDVSCCQPFPLSSNMKRLKTLKATASIGVAHNGVIQLTSDGGKDYSDTMKFITDYLVNIIQSKDWYKNERHKKLIQNLIGYSRLAFLDKEGVITMLGEGWIKDKGLYFSNETYKMPLFHYKGTYSWTDDFDDALFLKDWQKKYHYSQNISCETVDNCETVDDTVDSFDFLSGDIFDKYSSAYNFKTDKYEFTEKACPYTVDDTDIYCEVCSNFKKCSLMKNKK